MNYSELLHDFLDNSLHGANEETLFRALATDEELRFELKYLLNMREAVREDDKAFVVPVASTNAIFSQLGYMTPALVGAGGAVAVTESGLLSLLKSAGGYLVAMLVGALLTAGAFLLSNSSDEPRLAQSAETQTVISTATNPTVAGNGSDASIGNDVERAASATSGSRTNETIPVPTPTRSASTDHIPHGVVKSAVVAADETSPNPADLAIESKTQDETDETAANAYNTDEHSQPDDNAPPAVRPGSLSYADPHAAKSLSSEEIADIESKEILEQRSPAIAREPEIDLGEPFRSTGRNSISLEVRTQATALSERKPTTSLEQATTGPFDNISGTVSYGVADWFAILIEGGKESYLLNFNEKKRNGDVIEHEVIPSVLWGAVGARFNMLPSSRFNPFVQLGVGGSEAGVITRSMFGIQSYITRDFGLMMGVEYNAANYKFQGEAYTSPNWGVKTGVTFNLYNGTK